MTSSIADEAANSLSCCPGLVFTGVGVYQGKLALGLSH